MAHNGGKSFWSNPWTWAVGGCCLGCIGVPLLIITAIGGFGIWSYRSAGVPDLKELALTKARQNAQIIEVLGEPIESGFPRNTSLNFNNGQTQARLVLPLSGPKGEGMLEIRGEKRGGKWVVEALTFEADSGGPPLELNEPPSQ